MNENNANSNPGYKDEILPINPIPTPFGLNDKIFHRCDEEGNEIGEPYSYNEWIQKFKDISGVNKEFYERK